MFTVEDLVSKCGSPTYIDPEVLMAKSYDKAVDMWAVGEFSVLNSIPLLVSFCHFLNLNKFRCDLN